MRVVCCVLFVEWCLQVVVLRFAVRCFIYLYVVLLSIAGYMLFVVCCSLFAVCFSSCVVSPSLGVECYLRSLV